MIKCTNAFSVPRDAIECAPVVRNWHAVMLQVGCAGENFPLEKMVSLRNDTRPVSAIYGYSQCYIFFDMDRLLLAQRQSYYASYIVVILSLVIVLVWVLSLLRRQHFQKWVFPIPRTK